MNKTLILILVGGLSVLNCLGFYFVLINGIQRLWPDTHTRGNFGLLVTIGLVAVYTVAGFQLMVRKLPFN